MISKVVYTIVLSVVILTLLHHIYSYLMKNLTVPRVHDMITKPEQKYKEIYEKLQTPISKGSEASSHSKIPEVSSYSKIPDPDMKNELKDYIKNLTGNTVKGETAYTSPYTAI